MFSAAVPGGIFVQCSYTRGRPIYLEDKTGIKGLFIDGKRLNSLNFANGILLLLLLSLLLLVGGCLHLAKKIFIISDK